MELDSVRSAKADIFLKAFGYKEVIGLQLAGSEEQFALRPGMEAFEAVSAARRSKKREPRELIAIGVVPTDNDGRNGDANGFELAILVQHKKLIQHPIVEGARRLARGEARVIVTGPAVRRSVKHRCRPLEIGASIGHYRVTAGTLGCFVKCRKQGGIGILSNNHVLADLNRAKLGDEIIQPGRADGGQRSGDVIARLHRFIPLDFSAGAINLVDAAFATLVDGVDIIPDSVGDPAADGWRVGDLEDLLLDQIKVQKRGRTTCIKTGTVTAIGVDNLFISMVLGDPSKTVRFDQQIAISGHGKSFSKGGDSGSVVFAEERPVGLLFAGTERGGADGGGTSYANPISAVLDFLEIDIHRSR